MIAQPKMSPSAERHAEPAMRPVTDDELEQVCGGDKKSTGSKAHPLEYLTVTMTELLVTSVSTGGGGGRD